MTKFVLLLFMCHLLPLTLADKKYKLCVPEKMAKFNQESSCALLNANEYSGVECVTAKDRLECLRLLNSSGVDFTVLHPEELIVANSMGARIRITHELQKFKNVPNIDYSVVALVSYRISVESLADLKNTKMCSVGFDVDNGHDFDWNEIFTKFIEDQVVVPQQCNVNLSLTENRISSLASFFGDSCKAGKWASDPKQDQLLKQKYRGLCALCDDPVSCSVKDKYWGRMGAASCMTDCLGDVAWLRLDDWRVHEKTTLNKACSEFFFLCPDGSVQLSSVAEPCKWVSQPLPTVAVREDLATTLNHLITQVGVSSPTTELTTSWQWLARNLMSSYSRYIVRLENEFTPNYYLAKATNYLTASEDESGCDNEHHIIRLCAESGPQRRKCDVMAQVARAFGVMPNIECRSPDRKTIANCELMLKAGEADLMVISTDDFSDVLRANPNLKPILYQYGDEHRYAVAVVKKSSHIKSFAQLKNKRACFGMVGDLGWNAVLYQLMIEDLLPHVCPYEEALKQYFKDICAVYSPDPDVVPLCDEDTSHERNEAYEVGEILGCLVDGGGDVIFLDVKNLDARVEHEWHFTQSEHSLEVICPPGLHNPPSVYANTSCALLWATRGQLLIPSDTSEMREAEIAGTMRQIAAYFGQKLKTSGTPAESFKLFAPFDLKEHDDARRLGSKDLLLSTTINGEKYLSRNYEQLLPSFSTCDPNRHLTAPDSSSMLSPLHVAAILTLALALVL
ncbi:hypothetical protein M8J75_002526 [Diaphorina citri]|nr:hypothetical protein M8J75_002526 [Diaphorina citri]